MYVDECFATRLPVLASLSMPELLVNWRQVTKYHPIPSNPIPANAVTSVSDRVILLKKKNALNGSMILEAASSLLLLRYFIFRLASFSSQLPVFSLSSPLFNATGEILPQHFYRAKITGKESACFAIKGLEGGHGKASLDKMLTA